MKYYVIVIEVLDVPNELNFGCFHIIDKSGSKKEAIKLAEKAKTDQTLIKQFGLNIAKSYEIQVVYTDGMDDIVALEDNRIYNMHKSCWFGDYKETNPFH